MPVLTSVDCVPTQTGELGFFFLPFCGTSAAAPHVAGIAALLIERAPTLSTEQLRGVLTATAVDLGPPGFDFTYGFGRADAFQALSFVSSAPHVQLALSLNRHSVAPGDFLELGLFESNVGTATVQDFYFGALVPPALSTTLGCPAGDALLFFADAFARTVVLCYLTASPQSFAPLFASMAIPALLADDRRRQLRSHVAGGYPGRDLHVPDLRHAAGRVRRRQCRPDRPHRPGPRRPPSLALTRLRNAIRSGWSRLRATHAALTVPSLARGVMASTERTSAKRADAHRRLWSSTVVVARTKR